MRQKVVYIERTDRRVDLRVVVHVKSTISMAGFSRSCSFVIIIVRSRGAKRAGAE